MHSRAMHNTPANAAMRPSLLVASAGTATSRSGFTLIETIVAVGAVAIVAVGLASIFSAVGKTVAGGQRLSTLNQFSALVEDRLRTDIDQMTRNGVLVIRQQWVDVDGDGAFNATADRVPVSEVDPSPRPRRADELMFFAEGRFRTARPTMSPGVVAESDAARIYYGHGQRRRAPLTSGAESSQPYFRPPLSDRNNEPTSLLGAQSDGNPNRYAGEWTLVRHQTLLVEPAQVPQPSLTGNVLGVDASTAAGRSLLANRDGQISLQPAAGGIFRALSRRYPDDALLAAAPARFLYPTFARPAFGSGLVDIACSNLAELRSFVLSFRLAPGAVGPTTDMEEGFYAGPGDPPVGAFEPSTILGTRPGTPQSIDLMHAWMDDLMPTQSGPAGADQLGALRLAGAGDPAGVRIRTEPAGPDLLRLVGDPTATANERELAYFRGDQIAMASGGFLPRCSEFIVEWSFGNTDAAGSVIWHGLPRREGDSNGDNVIDASDVSAAQLFIPDFSDPSDPSRVRTRIGTAVDDVHDLSARVVYGYVPVETQSSLTSYFGFVDPTFNPAAPGTPSTVTATTLPCPWPRLIRVTVTISDATDPSIESTFQYVFRTPDDPGQQN